MQQVPIKIIITAWTLIIRATLALVVQMNPFAQCFRWRIHKCNHPGRRKRPKEVLKWVYIMQQVIGLRTLCKYFRRMYSLGARTLTFCVYLAAGIVL